MGLMLEVEEEEEEWLAQEYLGDGEENEDLCSDL
jgi:hypothetical protein